MQNVARRPAATIGAACALLLLVAAPAFPQYFGQNKVQYERFDFFVLKTDHFQIYHYPQGAAAVTDAAAMLADWYGRHEQALGFGIRGLQKVVLYDSLVDFLQTNTVPGAISQAEGGVTEALGNRVVVPLTGVPADNYHVLGHELVHAFQFQRLASPLAGPYGGGPSQPLWFTEGMAEYFSGGGAGGLTDMWMRDAVLAKDVPGIAALTSDPDRYFPYRFGDALWGYIGRVGGDGATREFFDEATTNGLSAAIRRLFGMSVDAFSRQWKEAVTSRYQAEVAGRDAPTEVGHALPASSAGALNLSPVASPDGRYVAVIDNRSVLSLELDLVDATNGRLVRHLARSDTDAHFDALRFIDSAGAWSADSRSFAFVVYREGDDAVAIVEAATGAVTSVTPFEAIDGISGLAWSPDGRSIVMSATRSGVRDLYLFDVGTGALEQLTDSWNAEIEPAWSPDGRSIAYATDIGGHTDRQRMAYGSMNLAVMDLATRQVRILSMRDGARHINPLYSPDGGSLYFVANADGYSDIYRYEFRGRRFYRLTRAATGVSGPTELSPCLTVARDTGDLVFTVFSRRAYALRRITAAETTGVPVEAPEAVLEVAPGDVSSVPIPSPQAPTSQRPAISPYRPSYQLVSISQASIGLSLSPYGAGIGAAVEALFEDVLGDHLIDFAAEVNGGIDTLGGQLVYSDGSRRLNWGAGIAHIPQQNLFLLPPSQVTVPGAVTAVAAQTIFTDQADLLVQYPLGRIRRLESDVGYELLWGESTATVDYYDAAGLLVGQGSLPAAAPSPLSLFHASLAFVGDNSVFGFTDPLSGYRYRLQAEQTLGSLTFLTALADARGYLFLRPFTIAARALHLGRYLADAENTALAPMFLGYPDLVRGYEPATYAASETVLAGRLSGSRIGVLNAEVRVPLLGTEQLGLISFPGLPTTLALFFDAGIAWSDARPPTLDFAIGAPGGPVTSAGVALRFNLLGVLVLQVYYAWPFQRPPASGYLGFLIEEGW